jgi:hypothetical protein
MRYPEKLMDRREGVSLDAAKAPFAEMLSVVSHCLPSLYRYAYSPEIENIESCVFSSHPQHTARVLAKAML